MPTDKDEGKEPDEAPAEKCAEQAKSSCDCGCIPPLQKK